MICIKLFKLIQSKRNLNNKTMVENITTNPEGKAAQKVKEAIMYTKNYLGKMGKDYTHINEIADLMKIDLLKKIEASDFEEGSEKLLALVNEIQKKLRGIFDITTGEQARYLSDGKWGPVTEKIAEKFRNSVKNKSLQENVGGDILEPKVDIEETNEDLDNAELDDNKPYNGNIELDEDVKTEGPFNRPKTGARNRIVREYFGEVSTSGSLGYKNQSGNGEKFDEAKIVQEQIKYLYYRRGIRYLFSLSNYGNIKNAIAVSGLNIKQQPKEYSILNVKGGEKNLLSNIGIYSEIAKLIKKGTNFLLHCKNAAHRAPSSAVAAIILNGENDFERAKERGGFYSEDFGKYGMGLMSQLEILFDNRERYRKIARTKHGLA